MLQQKLQQATGGQIVSKHTITRILKTVHIRSRKMATRTLLLPHHRLKRLQWAQQHVNWTDVQWSNVLNTDEVRICLRHTDGRRRVWRGSNERYEDFAVQSISQAGGGSVMFWAGICSDGKTDLIQVNGNMTSLRYIAEILTPHVLPFAGAIGNEFILQDDNARPHRGHVVDTFLDEEGIERLDWPAYSADISPIENLWSDLKKQVYLQVNNTTTLRELPDIARRVWTLIPIEKIRNLMRSMRRRCNAVIRARGGYIRY